MKTTDTGYINKNNQKNLGCRGVSETHYNQRFYEIECLTCGHTYMANGCDVWLRKCPKCGGREPDIHTVIKEKLKEIEYRENVKIIHCVESGSRAWCRWPDSAEGRGGTTANCPRQFALGAI